MADLRIVDAPVLLQESITDDVKMPTGGLGNFSVRLGDIVWYVVTKENLASKSYVDTSSQGVQDKLDIHIANKNNPHNVTKAQVGLGNVDNTADVDKPVSNAVRSAIDTATSDMATKAYVNQKDNLKADKATTLSGYNINDAYTKVETDSKISALSSTTYAGHKGYPTLAAAQAAQASLPANTLVEVTNDTTTANNGVYLWDGTTLAKSNFDVLGQAKTFATSEANAAEVSAKVYTDQKTKNIGDIDIGEALFAYADANDNLVEVTSADGQKYLVGLDGSVQENLLITSQEVATVKETLNHVNEDEISFAFTDNEARVVAYLKNDGNLILVDLNQSVQEELNQTKAALDELLTTIAKTEVKTVKGLVNSNYTVDASTILSMKVAAANSMPYIKMDSPYRKDDYFIHPCVIELSEPLRGYKYLMCITPYYLRNPMEENPTIYGSNDQVNWEMLTGFEQPLDNPPELDEPESGEHGYLSDNWWAYDPINKELYCCYRKGYYADYEAGYTSDDRMQLLYRKTTNGLQWTVPVMFTPETTLGVDGQVAPSLIWDAVNKRWALFYLKTSDWRIYVRFNTELKVEGWTEPREIGYRAFADANNIRGWHIETKFIGDKLFMLVGDSVNNKYYFAKANDDTFLNWTFSANSVLADTWTNGAYKASFIEVPQENGNIKLRLYFTTGAGRLVTSLSPEISII